MLVMVKPIPIPIFQVDYLYARSQKVALISRSHSRLVGHLGPFPVGGCRGVERERFDSRNANHFLSLKKARYPHGKVSQAKIAGRQTVSWVLFVAFCPPRLL